MDHPISSCVSWRTDWHPLCPPSFQASEARGQGCRMWGQGQQEVKARRGGRKPSGFSLARHFAPHSSGLDLPHLLCPLPLVLCLSHRASPLTELFLPRSPPSFSEPTPLLLPLISPSFPRREPPRFLPFPWLLLQESSLLFSLPSFLSPSRAPSLTSPCSPLSGTTPPAIQPSRGHSPNGSTTSSPAPLLPAPRRVPSPV